MNLKHYISIVVLSLSLFACEKTEFPENEILDPVFMVNGEINGQAMEFTPGLSGYYLFTDFEETYDGNYELHASIENSNCEDCEPSFGLVWISNTGEFHSNVFDVDQDLLNGEYDLDEDGSEEDYYIDISNIVEEFDFVIVNENPVTEGVIELVDGPAEDFLSLEFTQGFLPSCECYLELTNLNDEECTPSFESIETFSYSIDNQGLATFTPPENQENTQFTWLIEIDGEDGIEFFTIGDEELSFQFNLIDPFAFVSLLYIDDDIEVFDSKTILAFVPSSCGSHNISMFSVDETDEPEVMLAYCDGNGNEYFSNPFCLEDAEQDEDSSFEILSIEDYTDNEEGFPTKKIEFLTNCQLFMDGDFGSETIDVSNLQGTIAFSYPD